jgi:hypothetical protein
MVTFEDPNCGYCKKLAKEILTLKDVTVYTFLLPVLGDDSFEKSKAIWCAPDKAKAWVDWMTAGKAPPAVPAKCDTSGLNKSAQLGGKLRINGTPAIFFASGERVGRLRAGGRNREALRRPRRLTAGSASYGGTSPSGPDTPRSPGRATRSPAIPQAGRTRCKSHGGSSSRSAAPV